MNEPAFAWWAPFALKKRDRIIAAVNKRHFKKSHKFGIELPKTVEQALAINRRTGTTHWKDATNKEMKDVAVAFKTLDSDANLPVGYEHVGTHVVFDAKMGTLKRKARLVADGHLTETPPTMTHASAVSRESV